MIRADTHVHIYPSYDVPRFLSDAVTALSSHDQSGDTELMLFLTERFDCDFFKTLREGAVAGVSVCDGGHRDALQLDVGGRKLWIVAGRQIVSAEGVEVLSLTSDTRIADRQPLTEVLDQVRAASAVPVLSWAPGKWLGKRGGLIEAQIGSADAGTLCLGDTSMRPPLWGEPRLMRAGRRKGLSVICGSDPLPFAEDQGVVGRYATQWDVTLDPQEPVKQVRDLLTAGKGEKVGRRSGNLAVVKRFLANQKVR